MSVLDRAGFCYLIAIAIMTIALSALGWLPPSKIRAICLNGSKKARSLGMGLFLCSNFRSQNWIRRISII